MNIESHIKELQDKIAVLQKRIDWILAHRQQLEPLSVEVSLSSPGTMIDFDNLEHRDVIAVVRALGGKWSKSASYNSRSGAIEPRIDYQRDVDGVVVRCWQGKPPPNCRIVEVEEVVPAVVLPATTRKVKKLVCQNVAEPLAVAAAFASKPGVAP